MKKCAARPCASCPYRKDVPSGIWDQHEYAKLPAFDGEMGEQAMKGGFGLFMCHQRDGNLCAGWIATHGPDNLLALRLNAVDPSTFDYTTDVPVFSSGAEAHAHGMRDIAKPGVKAQRLMAKLVDNGKADFR